MVLPSDIIMDHARAQITNETRKIGDYSGCNLLVIVFI